MKKIDHFGHRPPRANHNAFWLSADGKQAALFDGLTGWQFQSPPSLVEIEGKAFSNVSALTPLHQAQDASIASLSEALAKAQERIDALEAEVAALNAPKEKEVHEIDGYSDYLISIVARLDALEKAGGEQQHKHYGGKKKHNKQGGSDVE